MTPAERLALWVAEKHSGQLIKKTGKPYFTHLVSVAEMAGPLTTLGYEIGLCHDLLEDTPTTENDLFEALISFNYDKKEAGYITASVIELTDVFSAEAYPHLSKQVRKKKETIRLYGISAGAQTVKYGDLADNIKWVSAYDQKHAKAYLNKKRELLAHMNKGNTDLRLNVLDLIKNELSKLNGLL